MTDRAIEYSERAAGASFLGFECIKSRIRFHAVFYFMNFSPSGFWPILLTLMMQLFSMIE